MKSRTKHKSCKVKEDRISLLPDCLIHHILSFLPSTKEAVKTGVLSKRWLDQWNHVPNLIFDCRYDSGKDYTIGTFFKAVDGALILNCCSNIDQFIIRGEFDGFTDLEPRLFLWLHYALRKQVKKLSLDISETRGERWSLPLVLYSNASVVELSIKFCTLVANVSINWSSLKVLKLHFADIDNKALQHVLNGSPLLECLEIYCSYGFDRFHIASKHLKCLELSYIGVSETEEWGILEFSAPYLQKLEIHGELSYKRCKFTNLQSLTRAMLGFLTPIEERGEDPDPDYFSEEFIDFQQFQHAKELELRDWCLLMLSIMEVKGLSSPLSNSRCLIMRISSSEKDLPGIASLVDTFPELEKLIINLDLRDYNGSFLRTDLINNEDLKHLVKKYWESYKTTYSVSCLKTVEITGLSASTSECKHMLKFVEFLLKHAKKLEKIIIYEGSHRSRVNRKYFVDEVSRILSSIPRSSSHSVVIFLG